MSGKGRRADPPKKKHRAKPRKEPVPPLTEDERAIQAHEEFQKAIIHLIEAERMAEWGQAPNACVHSAYYAMHHCACAAILASGGVGNRRDVPKSHEHVIEHYGKLVAGEAGYLKNSGLILSRARTDRIVADYDLVNGATRADATVLTGEARRFVEACKARWNFDDRMSAEREQ